MLGEQLTTRSDRVRVHVRFPVCFVRVVYLVALKAFRVRKSVQVIEWARLVQVLFISFGWLFFLPSVAWGAYMRLASCLLKSNIPRAWGLVVWVVTFLLCLSAESAADWFV